MRDSSLTYFLNPAFRHELRRVLNRGKATNDLKRLIYNGRVAPTRTEGINTRGVFGFPIEQYADQLLPSRAIPKMHLLGQ